MLDVPSRRAGDGEDEDADQDRHQQLEDDDDLPVPLAGAMLAITSRFDRCVDEPKAFGALSSSVRYPVRDERPYRIEQLPEGHDLAAYLRGREFTDINRSGSFTFISVEPG